MGSIVTDGEMMMICSSGVQVSPATPIKRVPGVPDGVGTEEGELAAVLCDLADLPPSSSGRARSGPSYYWS